jgi:hypothetical protein
MKSVKDKEATPLLYFKHDINSICDIMIAVEVKIG